MTKEIPSTPPNCSTPEGKKFPPQRASIVSAGRFGRYLQETPVNSEVKKSKWYFLTKF